MATAIADPYLSATMPTVQKGDQAQERTNTIRARWTQHWAEYRLTRKEPSRSNHPESGSLQGDPGELLAHSAVFARVMAPFASVTHVDAKSRAELERQVYAESPPLEFYAWDRELTHHAMWEVKLWLDKLVDTKQLAIGRSHPMAPPDAPLAYRTVPDGDEWRAIHALPLPTGPCGEGAPQVVIIDSRVRGALVRAAGDTGCGQFARHLDTLVKLYECGWLPAPRMDQS